MLCHVTSSFGGCSPQGNAVKKQERGTTENQMPDGLSARSVNYSNRKIRSNRHDQLQNSSRKHVEHFLIHNNRRKITLGSWQVYVKLMETRGKTLADTY